MVIFDLINRLTARPTDLLLFGYILFMISISCSKQSLAADHSGLTTVSSFGESNLHNNKFVLGDLIDEVTENDNAEENSELQITSGARLIVLNKITTKSIEVTLEVGEIKSIGSLSLELHKCVKSSDPYSDHNWMLLTIFDNKIDNKHPTFNGWVLSSNQSLSSLENPVYEVIPRSCMISKRD